MDRNRGFLEHKKYYPQKLAVEERIRNFREFVNMPEMDNIRTECSRCMDCGIPFCHAWGCPLGNIIPEITGSIWAGDFYGAWKKLDATSNFPELTGRLCPALCEASCSLSVNDYPVSVRWTELALAEHAFGKGWVQPRPPAVENGLAVAVIGSGPAGLAAAQQLRRAGFGVTVYEKDKKAGGILRYGIPSFKLEKWVLDRRLEQLEKEGVVFRCEVVAGSDISSDYLRRFYDVIVIATGAGKPREITAAGSGFDNIIFAMDYLSSSERYLAGECGREKMISAEGKNVLVLGGGDTGADCAGTAARQGAKKIYQYEIMEKPPVHDGAGNPSWPDYPYILRTSSSHEEGCERRWSTEVYQFFGRDILAEKAFCRNVRWTRERDSGAMKSSPVNGSEFELDIDLVIVAAGFVHTEHSRLLSMLGVQFDRRGNIMNPGGGRTGVEGVYAAGDCCSGASLVVRAVKSGRETAESVIMDFTGQTG